MSAEKATRIKTGMKSVLMFSFLYYSTQRFDCAGFNRGVREILQKLVSRQGLSVDEARVLGEYFVNPELDAVIASGLLIALATKGATSNELQGLVGAMRATSSPIPNVPPGVVDTCGTGGGRPSWNLSTAAAIISAACGAKVAKHGNRAVTSACGSADVLEYLGVKLEAEPGPVWNETGFAFLFAPKYYSALRHIGPIRKNLGVRTVFNQLGPMLNPAGAKKQMIGVWDATLAEPMAEALAQLGSTRSVIVHGEDEFDEVSPIAPTQLWIVEDGTVRKDRFIPSHPIKASFLNHGSNVQENAKILIESLSGEKDELTACALPNVGMTLWVAGLAPTVEEGMEMGREAVKSGKSAKTLERIIEVTNRYE
jgi:anthranilate phosphoribosyltransferase